MKNSKTLLLLQQKDLMVIHDNGTRAGHISWYNFD